jgi:indole-3-glycerol phosphate synthase
VGFLTDIVDRTRRDLADRPLDEASLRVSLGAVSPPRSLQAALRAGRDRNGLAVIAEVKRASPSSGDIASADPVAQARAYADGGAAAISVLTEHRHFGGSMEDLVAVCSDATVPVVRKDFLVDRSQILQARAAGADSLLLIVACLDERELASLVRATRDLGMEPLVETHSDEDLERALATDAEVIGVNARDLETLDVDVEGMLARIRRIPSGRVAVAESGIASRADAAAAVDAGASAILVGEALMRAENPAAKVRDLLEAREEPSR